MEQNFKNHSRLVPAFHYLGYLTWLAFLIGSIRYLVRDETTDKYPAVLFLLAAIVFAVLLWFSRAFALKAQDRAIRAEESLRYFVLTGRRPDPSLRLGQLIALRFASDEELPALAERAVREQLTNKQIKQEVRNWRADHHRV
ncbi:DUF6526 family protein [Flaviaesturariibacter aridisoli]|uniref:Uncharacterized protein n=1 Tax=Flaviaesturariibacter aridisoli TaxID=2545761 RepID=A0A4R4DXH9_9BACT|nr:DUF6526 family protein [Flaviaesturariibacter aridisoli]TCZ65675.1 hypothetical protein E0486_17285 [Flaviaesturariibacter aridisoli]